MNMNLFITLHECQLRHDFFPGEAMEALSRFGDVRVNELGRTLTEEELSEQLAGVDICITHSWNGIPPFSEKALRRADRLKLITHVAGSVAPFITDHVYERGIAVCSANPIMARYVAEGTLAYILSSLRQIPLHDQAMKIGQWNRFPMESLFNKQVALIGLGTVGRCLLELLKPFGVSVKVYDPYVAPEEFQHLAGVQLVSSLEEALSWGNIISLHASRTEETYHMLNEEKLRLIQDGSLLINTARGALIDEEALAKELASGRLQAVLDVYEQEPLPQASSLLQIPQVILQPHTAGNIDYRGLTMGMVEEIERFINHKPLQYRVPYQQFKLMTR